MKGKKLLICLMLVFAMVTSFIPGKEVKAGEKKLKNVKISSDGVISWDAFDDAVEYYLEVELVDGELVDVLNKQEKTTNDYTNGTSYNIYNRLDSNGKYSGRYKVTLVAKNDLSWNISDVWEGYYDYEPPKPRLYYPTNIDRDGFLLTWDAVPHAEEYSVYINLVSYGYQKFYTVKTNYCNISDYLLYGLTSYRIQITAKAEGYIDGTSREVGMEIQDLKPNYTITFDANGGTVSPASAETDGDVRLYDYPVPNYGGSTAGFLGWYTEKVGGEKVDWRYKYSEDTTIYARWRKHNKVSVTKGTPDKSYAINGETVTIKADDPPEGMAFDCWTVTGGITLSNRNASETTFVMPGNDVTATATYKWVGGFIKDFYAYVTPPVAGEHPQQATVKSKDYSVYSTAWKCTDGKKLKSTDVFEEGKQYVYYVTLAGLTKPYDSEVTGYINDSSKDVIIDKGTVQGKVAIRLTSGTFTATKADENGDAGSGNGNSGNGSAETPKKQLVKTDKGSQYYKEDGSIAKNEWVTIDNIKYYFNSDGYNASNEWIDGKWISVDGSCTYEGELKWKSDSTGWWVEDTKGWYPVSSWQKIDGTWYYFNASGYMACSEYYNGYWFNSDGSWDPQYFLTWKSDSTGWWVEDKSGWWPASSWLKIDGCWYYFNASGYMVTNQYVEGYWIGADGVCR